VRLEPVTTPASPKYIKTLNAPHAENEPLQAANAKTSSSTKPHPKYIKIIGPNIIGVTVGRIHQVLAWSDDHRPKIQDDYGLRYLLTQDLPKAQRSGDAGSVFFPSWEPYVEAS